MDEYERHHLPGKKAKRDDLRFISYLRPKIGNRKVSSISRRDIETIFRKKGETAPVQANRMLSFLSKALNLAIRWDWISDNPAKGINKYREIKRDRYVNTHELPGLMEAIHAEPNPYIKAAFLLFLLTGARRSEVLTLRWEDIDFETAEWRISDTKSGRSHVIPLSQSALKIIRALPRIVGNPFVIVGNKKNSYLKNPTKAWYRIRKRAGLEDVRIHDLRRTVGSYMAQGGASLPLIGRVLNHSNPSTTAIYARIGDEAPRAALEAIENTVMNSIPKNQLKIV